MTEPERPATPNGDQSEATVTAPAGAATPGPEMFTPKHGKGRLYRGGVKGNVGGGRHPQAVLDKLILIGDLTADEMLVRLHDEKLRAKMSADELRLWLDAVAKYFLARRLEHSGPEGGPIAVDWEDARKQLVADLQRRLQLRPPGREPSTPPPEPRGVASAAL